MSLNIHCLIYIACFASYQLVGKLAKKIKCTSYRLKYSYQRKQPSLLLPSEHFCLFFFLHLISYLVCKWISITIITNTFGIFPVFLLAFAGINCCRFVLCQAHCMHNYYKQKFYKFNHWGQMFTEKIEYVAAQVKLKM